MTTKGSQCSDGEIAKRVLAGDQAAFGHIVARHKQALHRIVTRLIGDETEAVDLVQETFLAAYSALARYDPDRPMRSWLTRIAVNKARDWRRRGVVRRWISWVIPIEGIDVADDVPGMDVVASDRSELRRVENAIARLPRSASEVLVLRTVEELSQAETARILGLSEKAVEARLYRARQKLKDELRRKRP